MANIKDFAVGIVTAVGSGTITLQTGEGARMPAVPFYATATPPGQLTTIDNSEKILVTARTGDVLTYTGAQPPTTTKAIAAGWIVANSVYKDDITPASYTQGEIVTGTINGTNTSFTVSSVYNPGSLAVYLNGQRLKSGAGYDYVETSGGFTMNYAPATGDLLTADFVTTLAAMTTTASFVTGETPGGAIDSSNLSFTTASPYAPNSLEVFIDGVRQTKDLDYTENSSGASFTFITGGAPVTGTRLRVNYSVSSGYLISGSNSVVTGESPSGTKNGTNPTFTVLSNSYVANSLQVYLNGVALQRGTDFVETTPASGIFTMQTGYIPVSTDVLTASYQVSITTTANADTVDGYHINTIFNKMYPVGSIYTNKTVATNPAILLDMPWSTWVAIENRMVMAKGSSGQFATAGATGGSVDHNHGSGSYYAAAEMFNTGGQNYIDAQLISGGVTYTATHRFNGTGSTSASSEQQSQGIAVVGTSSLASSLPPYLVAYMWERTA